MSSTPVEPQSFDKKAFGERVFQARKALEAETRADIPKEEMGRRLRVSGAAYGRWEKGEDKPNLDGLVTLARVLGVQPAWLAFGIGPRTANPGEESLADAEIHRQAEAERVLRDGQGRTRKNARRSRGG